MAGLWGRRRREAKVPHEQAEAQEGQGMQAPEGPGTTFPRAGRDGDRGRRSADGLHLAGVRVEAEGPDGVVTLLQDVDLTLTARRVAVVGENGSGKSTLARAVAGLADVVDGTVTVHGVDAVGDVKALRRTVGFVFANPAAQSIICLLYTSPSPRDS